MKLAILHHHLNPGGVTRVIENHVRALAGAPARRIDLQQVFLIHGGRAAEWPMQELIDSVEFNLHSVAVEAFDYDLTGQPADARLGDQIAATLTRHDCTPDETILHWHNHSLGKNASTPLAVEQLARRGYRLLLEIHDFAEDFRPQNYRYLMRKLAEPRGRTLPEFLYPQTGAIHYAVLNGRDARILGQAGVADDRLHFLPNPVARPAIPADRAHAKAAAASALDLPSGRQLAVYPVRGIRRKNLGEMLLWSALVDEALFAVTMRPKNPQERTAFDRWAALADELDLPCRFGVPASLSFGQALAASDVLLTTSVAEGFGMTFLEAWLAGRPLVGRRLPEITADFAERGVSLDHLYDELSIPVDLIDRVAFGQQLTRLAAAIYLDFGVPLPDDAPLARQVDQLLDGGSVDFARLPTTMQAELIRRVAGDRAIAQRLREANRRLQLPGEAVAAQVGPNAAAIEQHFCLPQIGERLADVYQGLLSATPSDTIKSLPAGDAILDAFLSIDRLHALRVES